MLRKDVVNLSTASPQAARIEQEDFDFMLPRTEFLARLPFQIACLLAATILLAVIQPTHAAAPEEGFDILEYRIEGNSVLPALAIEQAVYPHLGPGRSFQEVEAARAALEKAYQDSGYLTVSVSIPEQKVAEGVVHLQVVEGQVERIRVSGARYYALGEIKATTPELAEGKVPYFPEVQKQLAEVNRSAERKVTPLLRPGRSPGKLEVDLKVEDKPPVHGSVEINNKQSPSTSELRLEASLRYENLFQKQHSASLNYVISPQETDEVNVISGFYTVPLERSRSLTLYAVHSESNVISPESTVIGNGNVFGLRYARPLPVLGSASVFFHSLAAGFDYKDFAETQNTLGADQKVSPVSYLPFTAQYTAGAPFQGGNWLGNLSFVFNLRGWLDQEVDCVGVPTDQFNCRRLGARSDFSFLRGDLTYTRAVADWQAQLRLAFQASGQPLISNEQFIAGGADTVRGYPEGEAAGDFGWRLGVEARSPVLSTVRGSPLRGIAFVEGASLRLNDALAGQTSKFSLASVGVGLRLDGDKGLQFGLDLARTLKDGPSTASGDGRAHLRLGYQF
jgi:hemolysin activation/secretion protein